MIKHNDGKRIFKKLLNLFDYQKVNNYFPENIHKS